MDNFKKIFFHFYLYLSVLSHNYFLCIKNSLYNVKKTLNIEKKKQFSLYFWGLFLSKFWTQTLKNGYYLETFFSCKINLTYIGNFLGCVLFDIPKKACWRPALMCTHLSHLVTTYTCRCSHLTGLNLWWYVYDCIHF